MKKTLLTLGAVVAMTLGFASCGSEDCDCYFVDSDDGQKTELLDSNDQFPTITDIDDCDEWSKSDLPEKWQDMADDEGGGKIECSKH